MQEIMRAGHTILFVSHNMSAITRLCNRAIALNKGRIVSEGTANQVVNQYLNSGWGIPAEKIWENEADSPQNEVVALKHVRVCDENGQTNGSIDLHKPVGIEITYDVREDGHFLIPNFHIFNQERLPLFAIQDVATEWRTRPRERGTYITTAWLPGNFFNEGRLIVEIAISSHVPATRVHLRTNEVVSFEVVENPQHNFTRGDFAGNFPGIIRPLAEWTTEIKS
jgi:lipopolysaccharide transport system ATP-binding protein